MLEIFQQFVTLLKGDPTVSGLVTSKKADGSLSLNIYTGPVDITMEKQADLLYPSITMTQVSEVQRSVPINARDTQVQVDIWSRNSQLELETIYEAILNVLPYQSGDVGSNGAHIFWQRLGGAVDMYEGERRLWHRACTFVVWSIKE